MKKTGDKTTETITYEELAVLTNLIKKIYGFDFGLYTGASLKRRVSRVMQLQRISLVELSTLLTNSPTYFESFLAEITVNVTEMFRDPGYYKALRNEIIPYLSSYTKLNTWVAGCSTGEELYSLAILFKEASIYDRTFFYGTDINKDVLNIAKEGIYDLKKMKIYSENFLNSGAGRSLSDYYTAKFDAALIDQSLQRNVVFSTHNLASDGVFNEFQLICCRNVFIYFNAELQQRAIDLFYNSLANFGFLCLGSKETLRQGELQRFKIVDRKHNIYQKIA